MQYKNPEIKVSEFDKDEVIVASGTFLDAQAWMAGEDGSDAVDKANVLDFTGEM